MSARATRRVVASASARRRVGGVANVSNGRAGTRARTLRADATRSSEDEGRRERGRTSWDDRFAEIALFRSMRGTIELPRELNAQRRWLARQRYRARRGTLSEERMERLRSLGVDFDLRKEVRVVSERRASFDERVRELAKTYAAGEARSRELERWVSHAIADYRDGSLSEERFEALRDLGVDFDVEERRVSRWEERFAELEAYARGREADGALVVAEASDGLYFWLLDQRRAKRDGRLSPERIAALESLGVEWDVRTRVQVSWDERLADVRAFHADAGRLPRPSEDETLYQWIRHQRRAFESETLSDERIDALDAVCEEWKMKASELDVDVA